jgi:hypothetical protein
MEMQTKRFYVQANEEGRVTRATLTASKMAAPWIDTGLTNWAEPTEQRDGYDAVMFWDGKAIVWHYEPSAPMPEPEPTYEEPTEPTNEEISQMRQEAYEAECDSLLIAWMGYTAEGDTAKAESARLAYLRAKAEVRKRLPYGEGD